MWRRVYHCHNSTSQAQNQQPESQITKASNQLIYKEKEIGAHAVNTKPQQQLHMISKIQITFDDLGFRNQSNLLKINSAEYRLKEKI